MRFKMHVIYAAALAAIVFVLGSQAGAAANSITYQWPPEGSYIDTSQSLVVGMTVIPENDVYQASERIFVRGGSNYTYVNYGGPSLSAGEMYSPTHTIPAAELQASCANGSLEVELEMALRYPDSSSENLGQPTRTYQCGFGPEPIVIAADPSYFQINAVICGEQNDEVEYHQENVTVTGSEWSVHNLVFYLQANEGYTFADGTTATISYADPGNCVIQGSIPWPTQIEECGPANDTFRQDGELPVGVDPAFTVSANGDDLIVTYSPMSGYNFVTGETYRFSFIEQSDPCVVEITEPLTPPTIVEACGAVDTVTPATSQPEGVVVQPQISMDSTTGVITLTYSAEEGFVFADDYDNVIEHTDQGDNCPVLMMDIDDTTFQNLPTDGNLVVTGSLILDNVDLNDARNQQLSLDGTEVPFWDRMRDGSTWRYEWRAANSDLRAMCTDGEFLVEASVDVTMYGVTESYSIDSYTVSCSLGAESVVVIPNGEVNHIEICGNSDAQINDIITLVPQVGVAIEHENWGNGEYLIYLEPAQGYIFPPDTETLVRTRDNATQCGPSALNMDETSQALSNVQVGQEVTLSATLELPEGNPYDAANLTLRMAGTGEELHVSLTPTLGTGGVLPVEFTYVIPSNFEEVCSNFSGQMPLELTASLTGPTYSNPVGVTELLMDTAAPPCSLASEEESVVSISPDIEDPFVDVRVGETVVPVTVTFDGHVEDGVTLEYAHLRVLLGGSYIFGEVEEYFYLSTPAEPLIYVFDLPMSGSVLERICSDNSVELSAGGSVLYGDESRFVYVDSISTEYPCNLLYPVTPDMNAVEQADVCGDANDTFSTTQENMELTVGEWVENEATITFSAADGYYIPEGATASMTVTDENIACEEEPVDIQLTVILNTSDGGSIEGTPYQVHAPVASMAQQEPFAEGEVDAQNRIVLEGLLPGEYRLALAPEGYDPVDTTLVVTDGEESQEITIDVAAVQVPETPTSSPTATVEPTPTSTAEPTVPVTPDPTVEPTVPATPVPSAETTPEPSATEATVSGLPETGSGPGANTLIIGLAGLLAAAMIVAMLGVRGVGRR